MPRTFRLVATLLATVLVLTGCAVLPRSGGVHAADVQRPDSSVELDILPRGPEKDASQTQIVAGFIEAAASPQNRYEIARQYLTSGFATQWNPDAGALIDRGNDREYSSTGELALSLSVTPAATVTTHGQYAESGSTASVTLDYEFQKVKGQWRISKAPQGIVIDQPTFPLVFGAYSLYFFDPQFDYLVPDLRYFPRRVSTPTQIVRELLAGPSAWLTDAVVSAFPDGTALSSDAVQVIARNAQVPLNSDILKADPPTQQRMKLQLTASLQSVPTVGDVTIYANQVPQDIPSLADPPTKAPAVDSRALVLRGGSFGFLGATGQSIDAIPGLSETVAGLNPTAVTLAPAATAAAVLSAGGVSRVRAGEAPVPLDPRAGLIAPAIDGQGVIWSVPANDPGALVAFAPDGTVNQVATKWPDARRIIALRVSRDGSRVIALLATDGGTRFVAAGVIRGQGENRQLPVQLGDPFELAGTSGTPLDASWIDQLTVVSLLAQADGSTVLVTQQIGGPSETIDGSAGALTVTGGNTARDLRLLGADGVLEQRQGIGWQPRVDGVQLLGTQQGM